MKKILITGAGTGIGKSAAIALSLRGHLVYATTHTDSEAIILNSIGKKLNLPIKSFKLDITNPIDRNIVTSLNLDVLINNAAIGDSGSIAEINIENFKKVFETNVFSTIELTQLVLKQMIKNNSGKIIFISSLLGKTIYPFLCPYASSKFALECIALSLREELNELNNNNIQVTMIEPGAYNTGFNQKNIYKQFTWMKNKSYFKNKINYLKRKHLNYFSKIEVKSTSSIVDEYIKAVESKKVKRRYIAPKSQGVYVKIKQIIGL
ncbi:SDR family NAD(P)-dependent oxidoreductase [Clostridium sp. ATCC 25772]|uniref:SDR family NAD(P)-dependent oxidoreductase n=1 Tax=Clostridium sp. ATCC 25772 TaxID=1676991 RepID=UPI000781610F|nr:SDR family NAD(P)-dependent oxidoreductase [Clostridium sp. ATCC 25772]